MQKKERKITIRRVLEYQKKEKDIYCPSINGERVCPIKADQCPCPGRKIRYNVMHAQERECKRWAVELHDGLAQQIGGLTLELEAFLHNPNKFDTGKVPELFTYIRDELKNCQSVIREMIDDLRYPYTSSDILSTIRSYAERISRTSQVEIELSLLNKAEGISPFVQIDLFRIIQEALINVKKHAAAKHVNVKISREEKDIIIIVEDDGCGFDSSILERENNHDLTRFGLIAMKERAEMLGGVFHLFTKPGCGTLIKVIIPSIGTKGSGISWVQSKSR